MDFTVVDDIKETAAQVSDLIDQAKSFVDKGLDAAKNFVCVQILTIYQMVYLTAGQVIAIPYMAIKMVKQAIKKLDKAVISGAKDTFGSAVSSLMTAYTPEIVKYDPTTGLCTSEKKPSKIEEDPSYVQQALNGLKAAKNCPLLDSFTSTAGFESAFSAVELLAALDGVSPEGAAAALANAITNLATGIVDNLAKALEDTAFGALKNARSMYNSALKQSGIEDIFKLLGQGQSCLMDLCDDEAVLLKLEDLPLTPYLAKAGGFVEEQMEKIDSSYFTFTFDIDKSTGADKLSEEQQIDTTLYEPLPVINGLCLSNLGIEGAKNVAKYGYFLPPPYDGYYKAYMAAKADLVPKTITNAKKAAKVLHIYDGSTVDDTVGEFFLGSEGLEAFKSYVGGTWDASKTFLISDYLVSTFIDNKFFLEKYIGDNKYVCFSVDFVSDGNTILDSIKDAALCVINTEPGTVEELNSTTSCCIVHFLDCDTYKDTSGKQHTLVRFREHSSNSSDYSSAAMYTPTFFETYTTTKIQQLSRDYIYLPIYRTGVYNFFHEPSETTGAYAIFPFKKK